MRFTATSGTFARSAGCAARILLSSLKRSSSLVPAINRSSSIELYDRNFIDSNRVTAASLSLALPPVFCIIKARVQPQLVPIHCRCGPGKRRWVKIRISGLSGRKIRRCPDR
jgi:hypothetical protein